MSKAKDIIKRIKDEDLAPLIKSVSSRVYSPAQAEQDAAAIAETYRVKGRIAATVAVRELGFEPMPHFSARRITSEDDFEGYLKAVVERAGVTRCFIVAGDPPEPQGPYFDTSALIATGAFERAGIKAIGVGGHPEGHPNMTEAECWAVLESKVRAIESRGMAPLVVTQFVAFPAAILFGRIGERFGARRVRRRVRRPPRRSPHSATGRAGSRPAASTRRGCGARWPRPRSMANCARAP